VPKSPNPLTPKEITLSLNVRTVWYLDRLVESGLFGNSPSEAARIAIYDYCKILVSQGKIPEIAAMAGATATTVAPA
jgi:hypothetical protein